MRVINKMELYCPECERHYKEEVNLSTNSIMIEHDPALKKKPENKTIFKNVCPVCGEELQTKKQTNRKTKDFFTLAILFMLTIITSIIMVLMIDYAVTYEVWYSFLKQEEAIIISVCSFVVVILLVTVIIIKVRELIKTNNNNL